MATVQETITVKGSLMEAVEQAHVYVNQGYKIVSEWSVINWPFFWWKTYYVKMSRPVNGTGISVFVGGVKLCDLAPHEMELKKTTRITPEDIFGFYGIRPEYLNSLEDQLKEAIESEDYERAAEIRDQINGKK